MYFLYFFNKIVDFLTKTRNRILSPKSYHVNIYYIYWRINKVEFEFHLRPSQSLTRKFSWKTYESISISSTSTDWVLQPWLTTS